MGNIETTYILQYNDTYKVKVNFRNPAAISFGFRGAECRVAPRYSVCNKKYETDTWYKEVHEDGSFSLYVKDGTGKKWYIHEYHDFSHSYLGCFTEDVIPDVRRYIVEDGKIRVKGSPSFMGLGVTRWYPDFTVLDSLRDESVFIDDVSGKDYYMFAVYCHGEPLELVETTVGRRRPILQDYFSINN